MSYLIKILKCGLVGPPLAASGHGLSGGETQRGSLCLSHATAWGGGGLDTIPGVGKCSVRYRKAGAGTGVLDLR